MKSYKFGTRAKAPALAVAAFLVFFFVACQTTTQLTGPIHTIRVRHVSDYKDYEDHRVQVGESFFIADTDYNVKVERFVPDFAINLKTKEVISRSDKPLNPALQLAVNYNKQLLYETWVLYQNQIPHAIHEPGYYFQFVGSEILNGERSVN